jgi:hypothetical protein
MSKSNWKAGALSRGCKVMVMTKAQWMSHPLRAMSGTGEGGRPGLSDGVKPWINVIFSDVQNNEPDK